MVASDSKLYISLESNRILIFEKVTGLYCSESLTNLCQIVDSIATYVLKEEAKGHTGWISGLIVDTRTEDYNIKAAEDAAKLLKKKEKDMKTLRKSRAKGLVVSPATSPLVIPVSSINNNNEKDDLPEYLYSISYDKSLRIWNKDNVLRMNNLL